MDEDAVSQGDNKKKSHNTDSMIPQAQAYNEPHPGLHSYEAPGGDSRPPSDPLLLYPGEINTHDQYDSYEMTRNKPHHLSRHSEMNSIEFDIGGSETGYPGSYYIAEESDGVHIYMWTTLGFGPCSASCLGKITGDLFCFYLPAH